MPHYTTEIEACSNIWTCLSSTFLRLSNLSSNRPRWSQIDLNNCSGLNRGQIYETRLCEPFWFVDSCSNSIGISSTTVQTMALVDCLTRVWFDLCWGCAIQSWFRSNLIVARCLLSRVCLHYKCLNVIQVKNADWTRLNEFVCSYFLAISYPWLEWWWWLRCCWENVNLKLSCNFFLAMKMKKYDSCFTCYQVLYQKIENIN